jgi:hypothetical protein
VIKSQIRFFFYSVCGDKDPNNNLHYNGSRWLANKYDRQTYIKALWLAQVQ